MAVEVPFSRKRGHDRARLGKRQFGMHQAVFARDKADVIHAEIHCRCGCLGIGERVNLNEHD